MCASSDRPIRLEAIPLAALAELAEGRQPLGLGGVCEEGAWPPALVAQRALRLLAEGGAERWCLPYAMLDARGVIVGGCGFKGEPCLGLVEIGYAVAPSRRGAGIATAAVGELLALALDGGARQVLAQINPDNAPSSRLAARLGFTRGEVLVDDEGEPLAQWLWPGAIDSVQDGGYP
ncbi:GNAT family N-acetyltransferase [Chromobacterium alticapitis]|nr:GNAT family protein [Chromobacterium alticapitis]